MNTKTVTAIIGAGLLATMLFHVVAQQPTAPSTGVSPVPAPAPAPRAPAELPSPASPGAPPSAANTALYAPRAPAALPGGSRLTRIAPSTTRMYGAPQTSSSVPPLIIQFAPTEPAFGATMEEDMAIMTRLFERSLDQMGEAPFTSKLGIRFMLTGDSPSVRGTYLEGFGAVFMIKVNFPVFATSRPTENKQPVAADSDWEKAKRDLVGGSTGLPRSYEAVDGVEYDPELLARLTESLLTTLKNATNIRGLKAEESVAVTVFGIVGAAPATGQRPIRWSGGRSPLEVLDSPKRSVTVRTQPNVVLMPSDGEGMHRGTVLTLRAKRSDIDAFAKGELSFEAFRARVSTHGYAGNGYGMTSLNSWVHDGVYDTPSQPRAR